MQVRGCMQTLAWQAQAWRHGSWAVSLLADRTKHPARTAWRLIPTLCAQGKDADLLEGRGLGKAWEQVFAETDAAIQSDDGCTATAVLVWRAASGKLCLQVLAATRRACPDASWSCVPLSKGVCWQPKSMVHQRRIWQGRPSCCKKLPDSSCFQVSHGYTATHHRELDKGLMGVLPEQVANVGDSSAVLAELSPDGELKQPGRYLTADHRLSNPEERDRLKGLGIMLGHGGTRLYGLNLGRCLGDRYLKVCLHCHVDARSCEQRLAGYAWLQAR